MGRKGFSGHLVKSSFIGEQIQVQRRGSDSSEIMWGGDGEGDGTEERGENSIDDIGNIIRLN